MCDPSLLRVVAWHRFCDVPRAKAAAKFDAKPLFPIRHVANAVAQGTDYQVVDVCLGLIVCISGRLGVPGAVGG